MAQHDYNIANQTGLEFRADLNNLAQAIATQNSGPTEPTTTYAGMVWLDTSTSPPTEKRRNAADDGWLTTLTEAGRAVSGAADASAQRTALGLGTAATLNVGTSANNVVQLDGTGKLPAIDASLLTNLPSSNGSVMDQLALTNLRLMLHTGVATGALAHGQQWELATDEWSAGSSNYTYSPGAPAYYRNATGTPFTVSGSTGWTTYASSSISGSTITLGTAAGGAANTRRNTADLVGDFDLYYTQQNDTQYSYSATYGDTYQFGFAVTSIGTTNPPWENNSTNDWYIGYTPTALGSPCTVRILNAKNVMASVSETISAGDVIKLSRRGNVLTVSKNNVVFLSYTGAATGDGIPYVGRGTANTGTNTYGSVGWVANFATSNATLVSPAVSVASAPAAISAYMLYKDDSGSAVLGTDLTVEVSRDGGTTYTAATITTVASYDGTYSAIKARADVSAQPSGTSLLMRVNTLNTKAQRIAAPAIYAE